MEIVSIILNFVLASGLLGTLIFFKQKRRKENAEADGAELENTDKVIAIQSEQITRLDGRVEKLEEKVDKLEIIIEEKDCAARVRPHHHTPSIQVSDTARAVSSTAQTSRDGQPPQTKTPT